MEVATFEGVVDKGQIRLITDVRLPERTKVYVVVPDLEIKRVHIVSPRLVHPEQAADFKKEMVEVATDANIR